MYNQSIEYKEKQKICEERRKRLIEKATAAELIFKKRLDELKIKYLFQKGFIAGKNFCIVDFYLPRPRKIAIEIDGLYHSSVKQHERDLNKAWYLKSRKIKVLHIKNSEVGSINILNLINGD